MNKAVVTCLQYEMCLKRLMAALTRTQSKSIENMGEKRKDKNGK